MPRHICIIPDKVFHTLWNKTADYNAVGSYIDTFTRSTSDNYIDFQKKFGLKHDEVVFFLKEIFDKSNYSFKDILSETKLRKADISHMFCVPIRTVEDWYSKKNKMPSYFKLMLLRNFYLFNFDKIYIESEYKHIVERPYIYQRKLKDLSELSNKKESTTVKDKRTSAQDDIELKEVNPYEYYSKHTHTQYIDGIYASLSTREFLDSLSYLDDVMKK